VRDLSLGYALMHRHQIAHERREGLLFDLAADFDRRRYFSTQERLGLFLAVRSAMGSGVEAGAEKGWKTTLTQGNASEPWAGSGTQQQSVAVQKLKAGVSLRNDGASTVYLEMNAQGYPVKPMAVQEDRIKLERTLWTTDGKPATGRQFTTGDMLIVRLRVQAKQLIKDGLVVDRIPAGFEVENLNLSQGPQAGEFKVEGVNIAAANAVDRIVHTEYRDDRFVVAAKLGGQMLELFYLVRAVTPGRYVVPAPFAEDMYRPEIRGIGKAEADITVVDKRATP
jgi:alpha-2-macroglobulin